MAINKITKDKIAQQAIKEIDFARRYKQGKIANWQLNEKLYYSKKEKTSDSRANINLARMQEFVHTLLSKIDNSLIFKYLKRKNSQLQRVANLNALVDKDRDEGYWDMKDIAGKKQAIIYGRAVYSYYADSINKEYESHLENIDVYDFLIDPDAGGLDIERANYLGDYTVKLTKSDLEEGVKNGNYIKETVKELVNGSGNSDESSQEDLNKRSRTYDQNHTTTKKIEDTSNKFKFWRWFTTYEGIRYYLVIDNSGNYIKCVPLLEAFPKTKKFKKGAWPYWTWAAFIDLTEFWTPSYCDFAREIFMTQDLSIGQMVDNAEAINKPQRVVNVNAIENLAELKYRKNGIIRTTGDYDINRVYQAIKTPSITTPIEVYKLLESIQQKSSGVTDGEAGVEDTDGRLGIYEGNKEATADRFGLLNKSYSFGYKRFAELYQIGVDDNLITKQAVDIMGPDGIETKKISRRDIFRKTDEFIIKVEASNAEFLSSIRERDSKIKFLQGEANNEGVNQKKSFELRAKLAGLSDDDIKELQDVDFFGNSKVMSECDRDIEMLLDGEKTPLNELANNAYKQKMVNYLRDHKEDITMDQFKRIADYIVRLEDIIITNETRKMREETNDFMNKLESENVIPAKSKSGEILPQVKNEQEAAKLADTNLSE